MQWVTTPLLLVKCGERIQVCVASGWAWQDWSQNLSEEVASTPAFPDKMTAMPMQTPNMTKSRFLALGDWGESVLNGCLSIW